MAVAKKKSATARATMHNWKPAHKTAARKTPAKKATATRSAANPKHKKKKKHHNPSTAVAVRKNTTVKRSPGKVTQLSEFRMRGNPITDIGALGKTALVGLGGGVASRVLGAGALGLMDRFGLVGISQNKFASPVATAAVAFFFVPTLGRWVGISPQSQAVARMGGVLFAAADGLNSLIGNVQDSLANRVRSLAGGGAVLTNGQTAADAVKQLAAATQQAGMDAGLTPDQAATVAASAAQTALEGLEGIPAVDDVSYEQDYGWN